MGPVVSRNPVKLSPPFQDRLPPFPACRRSIVPLPRREVYCVKFFRRSSRRLPLLLPAGSGGEAPRTFYNGMGVIVGSLIFLSLCLPDSNICDASFPDLEMIGKAGNGLESSSDPDVVTMDFSTFPSLCRDRVHLETFCFSFPRGKGQQLSRERFSHKQFLKVLFSTLDCELIRRGNPLSPLLCSVRNSRGGAPHTTARPSGFVPLREG